jgi:hypothetical protein
MATDLEEFGKGVFDEPEASDENSSVSEPAVDQAVQLTDREIAIAKGEDPDAPKEEETLEENVIDSEEEDQDQAEEVVAEAEPEPDPFSLGDRKLAARYGLSEEDLQKFGTPEALHHAIDIFDKTGAKLESPQKGSQESPVDDSTDDAAAEDKSGALSELLGFEKLDVSKYENAEEPYDKDTIELVRHVRKTEDLIEKLTSAITSSQSSQNAEVFHDILDNYPEIYGETIKDGKPVRIEKNYESARQAVKDQAEIIYAGIVARKGQIPPVEKIIEQAMMAVHGKSISSNSNKSSVSKAEKLKKQSSMRRSTGSAASVKKRQQADIDPTDAGSIARHPDVEAFFRKAQEENGAV